MPSLLELQDLYNEALTRELIEKTKGGAVTWNHLGGTQFQCTHNDGTNTFDFYITKTQIGNVTYKYTLDVKKDSVAYVTIQDGTLPYSTRDSAVKDLYQIVETVVLELDKKMKETLQFVQAMVNCRDE